MVSSVLVAAAAAAEAAAAAAAADEIRNLMEINRPDPLDHFIRTGFCFCLVQSDIFFR